MSSSGFFPSIEGFGSRACLLGAGIWHFIAVLPRLNHSKSTDYNWHARCTFQNGYSGLSDLDKRSYTLRAHHIRQPNAFRFAQVCRARHLYGVRFAFRAKGQAPSSPPSKDFAASSIFICFCMRHACRTFRTTTSVRYHAHTHYGEEDGMCDHTFHDRSYIKRNIWCLICYLINKAHRLLECVRQKRIHTMRPNHRHSVHTGRFRPISKVYI